MAFCGSVSGAICRLFTDFPLGGSPGLPTGLPAQYYNGFSGCVRAVKVDDEALSLAAHASASHLDFC